MSIELAAVKASRDGFMQECNELKKQCASQRKQIDKLKKQRSRRRASVGISGYQRHLARLLRRVKLHPGLLQNPSFNLLVVNTQKVQRAHGGRLLGR